ncbi:MBL fold metallo-hydrolase [Solirubrobacter phytolaccae]|uniref:MBL fold metallo-hydrolase n=1 Tax=Solirubrobacter phytolaccae TaxID=1404360 RepID=A0A9X3NE88_9ACTN|nr:MBL fold metallo-hydrolase [Solirubrobacter phytolaccae]MDA0184456.1 MBL fold metallo-hydrolase [Solirubrobacter phytolaccae]
MKLTVFQSGPGDCVLVESQDGTLMLVDGGLAKSYREHVAPALSTLREAGRELDVVCVSHVDGDHIGGILALLDAEFDWRVHAFQSADPTRRTRRPSEPRPPNVKELWHNGFRAQLDADPRPVAELLSQTAGVLELSEDAQRLEDAAHQRDLAYSAGDGIRLSDRISEHQLDIPLNRRFGGEGGLLMVREARQTADVGTLEVTLLAPFEVDVVNFQADWHEWIGKHEAEMGRIREDTRKDLERLNLDDVGTFRDALAQSAGRLGDRGEVTAPNLASIMLLVREQDDKTLLLTGDGHGDDLLKGLEHAGEITAGGALHVNVLKVPHHGAEYNVDTDQRLYERITADHYVICANGSHHNPDLRIVDLLIKSRLAADPRPFKLWINSNPQVTGNKHMEDVRRRVNQRLDEHPGRFEATFLEGSSFDLDP